MKITSIKQQAKRADRYSIFVDEMYAFSLSADALLGSHLAKGDEITAPQVADFRRLSADDKVYNMVLRYLAIRPRSQWEIAAYLTRKDCPAPLIEQITNKLLRLGLVDDAKFAAAYVHDRRLLRPTSRRKMSIDLRKKHIAGDIIEQVVGNDQADEGLALAAIVERKRQQTRYQDDLKLMQYLARQGFNYSDIKAALQITQEY
ncbi:MAG: RecX family transcriptional regulator [Candidatus Saccharibacteria bacterium]